MGGLAGCFERYLRFVAWVSIGGVFIGVFFLLTAPNPLFGIVVIVYCAIISVCLFLLTDLQRWSRGSVIFFIGFGVCQFTFPLIGSAVSGNPGQPATVFPVALALLLAFNLGLLITAVALRK